VNPDIVAMGKLRYEQRGMILYEQVVRQALQYELLSTLWGGWHQQ
jgi:hypothetical protein